MKVKKIIYATIICVLICAIVLAAIMFRPIPYLYEVYADYFPIGVSCKKSRTVSDADLLPHFNSITPEYEMKWGIMEPGDERGEYFYEDADNLVAWARENGKMMRGHALVWYQNVPKWLESEATSKERVFELLEERIETVMTRYGDDIIYCWDVVNEALVDTPTQEQLDSGDIYRTKENEPWRFGEDASNTRFDFGGMCGKDYIWQSFRLLTGCAKSTAMTT